VSSSPPDPAGPSPHAPDGSGGAFVLGPPGAVPSAARWGGRGELRADLHTAGIVAGALLLCGLPAGVLWWWLAPRADFRITADGPAAIGQPSQELAVSDDSVLVLILVGLGLLAGALAWALRRRRGVAVVAALALGATAAAVVAWQVGELLGPPPTEAELADVGRVVTTPLRLSAVPALAVAPFSAVLAYLVGALVARGDDLGRDGARPGGPSGAVTGGAPTGEEPVDAGAR
jgi:Protein of unknown function (DUF2567)